MDDCAENPAAAAAARTHRLSLMLEMGAVEGRSEVSFAIAESALTIVFMFAITMSDQGEAQLSL